MADPKQELLDQLTSELKQAETNVTRLREKISQLQAEEHAPADPSKRAAMSALKTVAWVAPVVVATKLPDMNFSANAQSANPCTGQPPTPLTQECIDFTNMGR